jgi:type II secretory pathway predicted ATPase ExeA
MAPRPGLFAHRVKPSVRSCQDFYTLFVDDAHDLHPKTLVALKRLTEVVVEGGGQLSVVLLGHPKLKNDLRRPQMEEIGDRTTVFEFGGLRDRQRDYIDWVLKISLEEGVAPRTS